MMSEAGWESIEQTNSFKTVEVMATLMLFFYNISEASPLKPYEPQGLCLDHHGVQHPRLHRNVASQCLLYLDVPTYLIFYSRFLLRGPQSLASTMQWQ